MVDKHLQKGRQILASKRLASFTRKRVSTTFVTQMYEKEQIRLAVMYI